MNYKKQLMMVWVLPNKKFDEIYGESIEAKISDLKRTMQDFYSNLVNSEGLKQGIELLTKFINTFGDFPHIIGLATSALLIFKGKALTNLVISLGQYIISIQKAIKFSSFFKIIFGELNILFSKKSNWFNNNSNNGVSDCFWFA